MNFKEAVCHPSLTLFFCRFLFAHSRPCSETAQSTEIHYRLIRSYFVNSFAGINDHCMYRQ